MLCGQAMWLCLWTLLKYAILPQLFFTRCFAYKCFRSLIWKHDPWFLQHRLLPMSCFVQECQIGRLLVYWHSYTKQLIVNNLCCNSQGSCFHISDLKHLSKRSCEEQLWQYNIFKQSQQIQPHSIGSSLVSEHSNNTSYLLVI